MDIVDPPLIITVTSTTTSTVDSIIWRGTDSVLRMARAKATAPRRPTDRQPITINNLQEKSSPSRRLESRDYFGVSLLIISNKSLQNCVQFIFLSLIRPIYTVRFCRTQPPYYTLTTHFRPRLL